jgi:hypothetical protein
LQCNGSVNELSTVERPFSVGSVERGYLEDGATEQFSVGDSHGKFVCEEELKTK